MASYLESATRGIPDPFWVTFYLTVDPGTSPTLNATDVGTFLFKKMKLPELGVVLQVDLSAFKKIKIKIP